MKDNKPVFHPTFGSRPAQIVGREELIEAFRAGLSEPIGSRERCRFYVGQRGMGKTALLLELADIAREAGYVTAQVTAYDGMNDEIIEMLQRNGASYVKQPRKRVKGASAGALGFSVGLTFSDETRTQYGFRSKLTMLCDALEKAGKGVMILVDETKSSDAMRELAITYQHLVGEEKHIAIVMAGLPHAVSGVLNDDVLTFLNRASKSGISFIRINDVFIYYQSAFSEMGIRLSDETIRRAAEATSGHPYLMQLVGYYICKYAEAGYKDEKGLIDRALRESLSDMKESVFTPILKPLSDNDLQFLRAMAADTDTSKTSDICKRLGKSNSQIQPYRARMIDAGIIESPRNGELVFAVPYLDDYLRENV